MLHANSLKLVLVTSNCSGTGSGKSVGGGSRSSSGSRICSLREFAWSIRTSSCGPAREETPPNGVGWHLKSGQNRAKPGRTGQVRANHRIDGFLTKLPVQIFAFVPPRIGLPLGFFVLYKPRCCREFFFLKK